MIKQAEPKKKHAGGRPKNTSKLDRISVERIQKLYKAGFTDEQVADFFNISLSALKSYKTKHPSFKTALKSWKDEADEKVERSLYQRAIGYKYDEVTYEKSKTGGLGAVLNGSEIEGIKHVDTYKTKVTVKEIPPDVTAQIFWLKNRKPDEWRDKSIVGVGNMDDEAFRNAFFGVKQ